MKTETLVLIGCAIVGIVLFLYDPSPQKEKKDNKEDVEEVEVVELSKTAKLGRKTADALLAGYINAFKTLKSEGIEEGEEFTKRMSEFTSEMLVEVFDPLDEAAKTLEENYTTSKGKKFCSDLITGFEAIRKPDPVKGLIGDRKRRPFRSESCKCGEVCNCEVCTCEGN